MPVYSRQARDFAGWREAARPLLVEGVPPSAVAWSDWRTPDLLAPGSPDEMPTHEPPRNEASLGAPSSCKIRTANPPRKSLSIPRELLGMLESLACYRDASRWALMYRLTWRVLHENRRLLENEADADVQLARRRAQAVERDVHRMHAFVRFRESQDAEGRTRSFAWFEPKHEILRVAVPFFEQRFPNMHWTIATPDGAAVWDGARTEFVDSPARSGLPDDDDTHALWRAYYRNICNVARINPHLMQRDLPRHYWANLPEATEIDSLIREGRQVYQHRLAAEPAAEIVRAMKGVTRALERISLPAASLQACRACDLWRHATQAVEGEGPTPASIMLVGEQPGDAEDLRGRPFVGPAGQLLDEVLRQTGLDRRELYVTNAVKHFKWEPRGKLRLHRRPDVQEIRACGSWLTREIESVRPKVIVALGATALRAVAGLTCSVEQARTHPLEHPSGALIVCTYHPSAVLRADDARKAILLASLRQDLHQARQLAREHSPGHREMAHAETSGLEEGKTS